MKQGGLCCDFLSSTLLSVIFTTQVATLAFWACRLFFRKAFPLSARYARQYFIDTKRDCLLSAKASLTRGYRITAIRV